MLCRLQTTEMRRVLWVSAIYLHFSSSGGGFWLWRSKSLTSPAKLTKMLGFHKVSPPSSSGPFRIKILVKFQIR